MVHRGSAWARADEAGPVLRDVLRTRTRAAHAALDHALTIPSHDPGDHAGDHAAYVRVLSTLHTLHGWSDARLRVWAATSPLAASLPGDVRLPWRAAEYAADLAALGATAPPGTRVATGTSVPEDGEGLALLYLVAGSTAGARVLLRGLPDTVPAAARTGLTEASGPAATRLWKATRELLAVPASSPLTETVVAEANDVFAWLRDHAEERVA